MGNVTALQKKDSKLLRNENIWFGSVSYLIQVDESFQRSVQWAAGSGQAGLKKKI
jgi:hypothetical protein